MPLKGEVGGSAFNIHGNYIVYQEKIMELFFNFCGNPDFKALNSTLILKFSLGLSSVS